MAGPDQSPLEKFLADHVVAQLAELLAAQTGGSLPRAAFRLKTAEAAQRRFLAATKSLTALRALQPRAGFPRDGLWVFDPEGRKTG